MASKENIFAELIKYLKDIRQEIKEKPMSLSKK
jgi:hypothetical protein